MSQYAHITDIALTDDFTIDYDRSPEFVQKRVNKLVEMMMEGNQFPTSMDVRQSFKDDLWMGNVTQKRQAWRVLFWIEENTVILHRLLTHEQRDRYLRI